MGVLQVIFVVETNDKTQSDDRYIKKLVDTIYPANNNIKFHYIHMETKYKYKSEKLLKTIKSRLNQNKDGTNSVLFCFDTDQIHTDNEACREIEERKQFCLKNNFYFVWFCYDIESVFLGRSVNKSDKEKESIKFYKSNFNLDENLKRRLSKLNDYSNKTSNILTILNYICKSNG